MGKPGGGTGARASGQGRAGSGGQSPTRVKKLATQGTLHEVSGLEGEGDVLWGNHAQRVRPGWGREGVHRHPRHPGQVDTIAATSTSSTSTVAKRGSNIVLKKKKLHLS